MIRRIVQLMLMLWASINVDAMEEPVKITFGTPVQIADGTYGRVHPIGGNRYALVYEAGGVRFRVSSDGCRTWNAPVLAVPVQTFGTGDRRGTIYPANPELRQVSGGRLVLAYNGRPHGPHPFEIGIATSDDGGKTWSAPRAVYSATNVLDGVIRGCYEPSILERNGRIRIFFADESPYVAGRAKFQNVSYIDSHDRGRTWSASKTFCYTPQARDGMPVAETIGAHTYVAIESNGGGTLLHPQIVRDDGVRMEPHLEAKDWHMIYAGAPYLAAMKNYVLLSYQSSEGSGERGDRHVACEVVAMPRSEIRNGLLNRFRGAARPIAVDQKREAALWNALCPLGGDDFLVVSQYRGRIFLTRGRVSDR